MFTHLPVNSIVRCLMNVERVLKPGGKFFATFYENEQGKRNLEPIRQSPQVVSYFDRDSYHYDVGTFEWVMRRDELDGRVSGRVEQPTEPEGAALREDG